jgi:hypothetical protein
VKNEESNWSDFHAPDMARATRTAYAWFGWTLLDFALLWAVVYPVTLLVLQWAFVGEGRMGPYVVMPAWHLWVAPALQEFFGDFCGHFCQYCRLSGLFVWWCSTGPDEFRKRGSNRLIGLKGPLPFPECPCSWLTYFRIITSTSCISWAVGAVRTQAAGIPVSS